MAPSRSSAEHTIERVNITLRTETRQRLNQARRKRAIHINVSAVCDAAITAELDRLEFVSSDPRPNPGVAELAARIRAWMELISDDCTQGSEVF